MKKSWLLRFMGLWPPYLGSGIRIRRMSPDYREIEVELRLRFWNQNYFGTLFGGSLYAMIDPFYALMLTENLGRGYEVWDKAASIRFKKPGRGIVRAHFTLSQDQIERVRAEVDQVGKAEPVYLVRIVDLEGGLVAEAEKRISVRKRPSRRVDGDTPRE